MLFASHFKIPCSQLHVMYDRKGTRRVRAATCVAEKVKLSCAFTAAADGTKLPLLILLPRKKPLNNFQCPDNVIIHYQKGTNSFTAAVMNDVYLTRIFSPHIRRRDHKHAQLFLDQAPYHKARSVVDKFKNEDINIHFIPACLTDLLQPADVGWFHTVRCEYRNKWTGWYITSAKAWTKQGNLKSPGYALVRQLIALT